MGVGTSLLATFGVGASLFASPAAQATELRTLAEQSGYQRTGRYAEVERLCQGYARQWPRQVRCFSFGTTPQGHRCGRWPRPQMVV